MSDIPKTVWFFGKNKRINTSSYPYTLSCGKNMEVKIYDDGITSKLRYTVTASVYFAPNFVLEWYEEGNDLQKLMTKMCQRYSKGLNSLMRLHRNLYK